MTAATRLKINFPFACEKKWEMKMCARKKIGRKITEVGLPALTGPQMKIIFLTVTHFFAIQT